MCVVSSAIGSSRQASTLVWQAVYPREPVHGLSLQFLIRTSISELYMFSKMLSYDGEPGAMRVLCIVWGVSVGYPLKSIFVGSIGRTVPCYFGNLWFWGVASFSM